MPRKASGEPKVKRIERPQSNGDIYIYEVTTLYNPEKRYNEHVSSRLLGKKSPDGNGIVPTRPHSSPIFANIKSVWASGKKEYCCRPSPKPTPVILPAPNAYIA